jgi:Domain of unknown function (DUF4167)
MAFVRNNNNNNRRHNNNYNNRHRSGNQNGGQNNNGQRRHVNRVNQVFESNGPDGRIRGTAQQIVEKYATLARDASISGDKVLSMNYLQHAEHYQRLLNEITEENAVFEKEREEQRAAQQAAQPQLSPSDAEAGFASTVATDEQPQSNAVEAPQRQERPQRGPRPERGERPQPREKRPADDIDDNELPSFLHVPITTGKPAVAVEKTTRAVPGLRPRRTAADKAAAPAEAPEAPVSE